MNDSADAAGEQPGNTSEKVATAIERHEPLWEELKQVIDPELHMNIVDLGLIYEAGLSGEQAVIRMTLTSPGCPYGPYILHDVDQSAHRVSGVKEVDLQVVWDPPWGPERMTEDARLELGFDI